MRGLSHVQEKELVQRHKAGRAFPLTRGLADDRRAAPLKKALKKNELPIDFPDLSAIAQDRAKWRTAVYAKDTISRSS